MEQAMRITSILGKPLVRLRGRGNALFWEREWTAPSMVLVIPIIDGVPVVHQFFHVPTQDIIRGDDDIQPGFGQSNTATRSKETIN